MRADEDRVAGLQAQQRFEDGGRRRVSRRNDRRKVISPVPLHRLRPWAGPVFPREAVGTEKSVFSGEKPGKYG